MITHWLLISSSWEEIEADLLHQNNNSPHTMYMLPVIYLPPIRCRGILRVSSIVCRLYYYFEVVQLYY